MIAAIPMLYRYIGGILILALVFGGVFGYGYSKAKDKYQGQLLAERAEAKARYDAQAAENERIRKQWANALGDRDEVQAKLDAAGDYGKSLAERLLYYKKRQCPLSSPSPTPAGTGGEGEVPSLDERIGQATERVFADCRTDSERLTLLQGWYNRLREAQ